jgi:cell division protein FtsI/penicillin-binding protein 2
MRTLLAGVLVATLTLTACSGDEPAAEDVAAQLATALEKGSLPAGLFRGESPQPAYDEVVDGVLAGPVEAETRVDVVEVAEDGGTAEATLGWTWELGPYVWEYESTAALTDDGGWAATWDPALVEPSLAEGETLAASVVAPRRGEIQGAGGVALVSERPVVRYGIDKTKVAPRRAAATARAVAGLLGVRPGPFVKAVRAAGPEAFVEGIVLRPGDASEVDPSFADIRGAVALEDEMPLAPTREFAAPILGRVGPATAELIEEAEGRLAVGDVTGLSGLQARYDEQLSGTVGVEIEAVAEPAGARRSLFADGPVDGEPLRTTLDPELQGKAERILAAVGEDGPATAVVALRPSDGAVLAAANGPGNGGLNAATYGQYAPGSTFKVVTALALLRSGLSPGSTVQCPPSIVVDGKTFENYDDYPGDKLGSITLREAVAHSCNTAFIGARDRLSSKELAGAAESLGVGVDHDLGFPAYFGQVPRAATETEAAADMIGQGKILASPMAMAAVAASVRSGSTVVPHLLEEFAPQAAPTRPLSTEEAGALRGLMRAVVTEGSGGFLAELAGEVGAKTGTAEYGGAGPGGAPPTHAWMIAHRDDLAVAVFVEDGESGSQTAGPLLEAFLS